MKRFFVTSATAAIVGMAIALSQGAIAQTPQEGNLHPGVKAHDIAPGSAQPTRGVVFFTAAVNSDGSVAGCFGCKTANTHRVAVGRYIVDFGQNVQAVNGWSRWVQPDTLQTGQVGCPGGTCTDGPGAWCTTADSAADSNAVWINCQTPVDPEARVSPTFSIRRSSCSWRGDRRARPNEGSPS